MSGGASGAGAAGGKGGDASAPFDPNLYQNLQDGFGAYGPINPAVEPIVSGPAETVVEVGPTNKFQPIIPDESGGMTQTPTPQPGIPTQPSIIDRGLQGYYDAMDATRGAMNYQPMMVNPSTYSANTIDPSQFNLGYQNVNANDVGFGTVGANSIGFERITSPEMQAAQTTQADIDRFLNPYTTEVVDQSMADIERNRLMQANQAAAQAQAAGAFGGSRGALMEAEIARNALDQSARTAGDLRRQGFTTAAQLAQQDVARRQQAGTLNAQQALQAALANQRSGLQAGMSNQQANLQAQLANQRTGLQAGLANQQSGLQAALANQQAGLTSGMANMDAGLRSLLANQGALNQASQFNINQDANAQALNQAMGLAGAQNALAGANQLANLGLGGVGMGQDQLNTLQGIGAAEQGLQQLLMDAAKGQYGGYQGQGQALVQLLSGALGASQIPQSQTTSRQPGLFDYLGLAFGA